MSSLPGVTARIWPRIASALIDMLIVVPIMLIVKGVEKVGMIDPIGPTQMAAYFAGTFVHILVSFYAVYFYARSGMTPGMKLLKVRIVRVRDGSVPTFFESSIRECLSVLISLIGVGMGLFGFWMTMRGIPSEPAFGRLAGDTANFTQTDFVGLLLMAPLSLLTFVNLIVLLVRRDHRAITDLMAGTAIIEAETPAEASVATN